MEDVGVFSSLINVNHHSHNYNLYILVYRFFVMTIM